MHFMSIFKLMEDLSPTTADGISCNSASEPLSIVGHRESRVNSTEPLTDSHDGPWHLSQCTLGETTLRYGYSACSFSSLTNDY